MDEIMVSICCLVYNHEKYLRQCLDGFMMQKTNFKYEILIHDDASTDHSAEIIRKYEEMYPKIIKPIYQAENQHSKGVRINWVYQFPRARGKYIAFCEGDDFWTDEKKLQKQFDALEENTDCVACLHKVAVVRENGQGYGVSRPLVDKQNGIYSQREWLEELIENYDFQTSSFFFKGSCLMQVLDKKPDFMKLAPVGDWPLCAFYATKGALYYINETMSSYRLFSTNSWTSLVLKNKEKTIHWKEEKIQSYHALDSYTNKAHSVLIDKKIRCMEFDICVLQGNYKMLRGRRYLEVLNSFSWKGKLYFFIQIYLPFLGKMISKVRKNKETSRSEQRENA